MMIPSAYKVNQAFEAWFSLQKKEPTVVYIHSDAAVKDMMREAFRAGVDAMLFTPTALTQNVERSSHRRRE